MLTDGLHNAISEYLCQLPSTVPNTRHQHPHPSVIARRKAPWQSPPNFGHCEGADAWQSPIQWHTPPTTMSLRGRRGVAISRYNLSKQNAPKVMHWRGSACRFPRGEAAPVRTLGLKRNAGDQPICGSSIRPAERSPIPKPKHCTCRKLTARIPLPTRLRRATFPPGEGIAPCGRPAPKVLRP